MIKYSLQVRKQIEVNTDPYRRCYNGCHYSSEMVWTEWTDLTLHKLRETAQDTLDAFQKANPKHEYQIVEVECD